MTTRDSPSVTEALARKALGPLNRPELPWPMLFLELLSRQTSLSAGEQILVDQAGQLWNGQGATTMHDVFSVLDNDNVQRILECWNGYFQTVRMHWVESHPSAPFTPDR